MGIAASVLFDGSYGVSAQTPSLLATPYSDAGAPYAVSVRVCCVALNGTCFAAWRARYSKRCALPAGSLQSVAAHFA